MLSDEVDICGTVGAAERAAHAERLLDIARRALDGAINRAMERGDRDEVEALHRDRRLLGYG